MNKIILLVFAISISMIMGHQAAYAAADVWAFYGEFPQPDTVTGIGGGSVDAHNNPNCANPPSCTTGVANVGANVPSIGHSTPFDNLDDTAPRITVLCFDQAPDPTDQAFAGFDFSSIINDNCVQNQRGAGDLGIGVEGLTVTTQNPNELQFDEMIVVDIGPIISAGYFNPMLLLSSHTSGHVAWIATSSKAPSGIIAPGDLTPVPNPKIGGTDGIFPGSAQGTDFNDAYLNFPLKRYIYFQEVSGSTNDGVDYLLQQIKAEMPMIGGTGVPIEQSALLISGMKTTGSYMIPILMAAAGFGILIARRF